MARQHHSIIGTWNVLNVGLTTNGNIWQNVLLNREIVRPLTVFTRSFAPDLQLETMRCKFVLHDVSRTVTIKKYQSILKASTVSAEVVLTTAQRHRVTTTIFILQCWGRYPCFDFKFGSCFVQVRTLLHLKFESFSGKLQTWVRGIERTNSDTNAMQVIFAKWNLMQWQ